VWRVDRPRSWGAPLHPSTVGIMIIGPILLAVALGPLGLRAAQLRGPVARLERNLDWLMHGIGRLLPYASYRRLHFSCTPIIPNSPGRVSAGADRRSHRGHHLGGGRSGNFHGGSFCTPRGLMAVYTGFAIVLTQTSSGSC